MPSLWIGTNLLININYMKTAKWNWKDSYDRALVILQSQAIFEMEKLKQSTAEADKVLKAMHKRARKNK